MDRRYQVFISSTYTDLLAERAEVIQAVLELDGLPAGMELFPAANEDQWSLIQRVIDQSDYYVVIVGGRYGSTTDEGISFTEKEYDYAVKKGLPVLGFVHANPEEIPVGKSDISPEARERLEAFRTKVKSRMVKQYSTPTELGSVVSRGLSLAMRNNPREGWVRGSEAMTAEVRTEIAELRAALSDAQRIRAEEAAAAISESDLDFSFEHGHDTIDLTFAFTERAFGNEDEFELTYSWDQIFRVLGPFMIDEADESSLRKSWEDHAFRDVRQSDSSVSNSFYSRWRITDASWGDIIVQLRAVGLIETSKRTRGVNNRTVFWTLTSGGDRYLVNLRGIKREPTTS